MAVVTQVLTWLGAVCASILALRLYNFIRLYTRSSDLERYRHKEGHKEPWALITGSSDGIGLAFAYELASAGFNVILHGRNLSKLENAKKSIAQEHPSRSIRIIVAEFITILCSTLSYNIFCSLYLKQIRSCLFYLILHIKKLKC